MMIYNDSVTGTSVHVNMPQVTPAMVEMAEKSQDKRLVIEVEPLESPTQSAIIHIQRAITLLQHDPDAVFALGMVIPDIVMRASERCENVDPLMGA